MFVCCVVYVCDMLYVCMMDVCVLFLCLMCLNLAMSCYTTSRMLENALEWVGV